MDREITLQEKVVLISDRELGILLAASLKVVNPGPNQRQAIEAVQNEWIQRKSTPGGRWPPTHRPTTATPASCG